MAHSFFNFLFFFSFLSSPFCPARSWSSFVFSSLPHVLSLSFPQQLFLLGFYFFSSFFFSLQQGRSGAERMTGTAPARQRRTGCAGRARRRRCRQRERELGSGCSSLHSDLFSLFFFFCSHLSFLSTETTAQQLGLLWRSTPWLGVLGSNGGDGD